MRIPLRRLLTLLTAVLAPATTAALTLGGPAYADPSGPSDGVWPLAPRPEVVARFDPPATRWGAGHRGADLLGRAGQPVRTALAGRVSFAGTLAGRGVVVVDHGRTRTTYEPVTASVSVGHRLAAGAVLGRLQVFGSHCFPASCLHWGLIEGRDHYLDPLTLVGAGQVRLVQLHEVGSAQVPSGANSYLVPTAQLHSANFAGWQRRNGWQGETVRSALTGCHSAGAGFREAGALVDGPAPAGPASAVYASPGRGGERFDACEGPEQAPSYRRSRVRVSTGPAPGRQPRPVLGVEVRRSPVSRPQRATWLGSDHRGRGVVVRTTRGR